MKRSASDKGDDEPYWLEASASHLLHRAEQLAQDRFARLVNADHEVTLRQFALLAAIDQAPGCSQADLVRITGIDRSTLAEMVTRLSTRGLVARSASTTDQRVARIRLTATGQSAVAHMTQQAKAADAAILDPLPSGKRKTFLNILAKLARYAEQLAEREEKEAKRQAKDAAKRRRAAAKRKGVEP